MSMVVPNEGETALVETVIDIVDEDENDEYEGTYSMSSRVMVHADHAGPWRHKACVFKY